MADTYTETTRTSWGSRLGGSFRGVLFGIVLVVAGTALLWWNEGRTVRTGDTIAEARLAAEELPDINRVDPAFDGRLVHAAGVARAAVDVTDEEFGITRRAISLKRTVECYQWVESSSSRTEKKLGGGEETVTTWIYEMQWAGGPVNSSSFRKPEGHENRVLVNVKDRIVHAGRVGFGAYTLSDSQVRAIGGARPPALELTEADRMRLQRRFFPSDYRRMVHVQGSVIYLGANPAAPAVGDVRVSFEEVPDAQTVSIIAQTSGSTFTPWKSSNGREFSSLTTRAASLDEMMQSAEDGNAMMAWMLRALGITVVVSGLRMILAPLSVVADVIPMLGSLVARGTGLVASLLGVAWSFVVIAVAWIRFRPLAAGCLLGIAAICMILSFLGGRRKSAPAVPQDAGR